MQKRAYGLVDATSAPGPTGNELTCDSAEFRALALSSAETVWVVNERVAFCAEASV